MFNSKRSTKETAEAAAAAAAAAANGNALATAIGATATGASVAAQAALDANGSDKLRLAKELATRLSANRSANTVESNIEQAANSFLRSGVMIVNQVGLNFNFSKQIFPLVLIPSQNQSPNK